MVMKKNYKYYYIYKITCACDPYIGYYYLGKRKTDKIPEEDEYAGSSAWMNKNYWPIYGKIKDVTYKKEILFYFNSQIELDLAEHAVIGNNYIDDEHCVNMQQGGSGGFGAIPWNKGLSGYHMKKRGPRSEEEKKVISEAIKNKWNDPEYREKCSSAKRGKPSSFKGGKHKKESIEKMRLIKLGKKQSEETKKKKSEKLKGHKGANIGKHRVYRADGSFYMSF